MGVGPRPPAHSPGHRPVAGLHQLFAVILFQQLLQGRRILCGQLQSKRGSGQPPPGSQPQRKYPFLPITPSPAWAVCLSLQPSSVKNGGKGDSTISHIGQEGQAGPGV